MALSIVEVLADFPPLPDVELIEMDGKSLESESHRWDRVG